MKAIKDRAQKLARLIWHQGGLCGCGCGEVITMKMAVDLHHKMADHAGNRAACPMFIDSLGNLTAIIHDHHVSRPVPIMTRQEGERWEAFIGRHPIIGKYILLST